MIDGVIHYALEWSDAIAVDVSDTMGIFDHLDTLGSALMLVKHSTDALYIAVSSPVDTTLIDWDQISLYIDDNHDGICNQDDTEGYYHITYHSTGWWPETLNEYFSMPSYHFEIHLDSLAKISGRQHLQFECKIPIGHSIYDLNAVVGDTIGFWMCALDFQPGSRMNYYANWLQSSPYFYDPSCYGDIVLSLPHEYNFPPAPPTKLNATRTPDGAIELT